MQKTVIIYDQLMENPISFIVMDGDLRRFDKVYINQYSEDAGKNKLQDELCVLLYGEDGESVFKAVHKFPVKEVVAGAHVIVAGFIP